jgi:hypothetical protein
MIFIYNSTGNSQPTQYYQSTNFYSQSTQFYQSTKFYKPVNKVLQASQQSFTSQSTKFYQSTQFYQVNKVLQPVNTVFRKKHVTHSAKPLTTVTVISVSMTMTSSFSTVTQKVGNNPTK